MNSSRGLLLSFVPFVLVALAAGTGCSSATAAHPASSPATMDASWMPPEAVDLAIRDGAQEAKPQASNAQNSYRPNREAIPQHGAVHPAVY